MPRATRARTRGALATRNAGEDNASGDVASHPTKAVGAAKRAAAGAADGARAALAEEVEREIREMELELETRCAALMQAADDFASDLRKEIRVQLIKIPKKVRAMSVEQFTEAHVADVSPAVLAELRALAGLPAAPLEGNQADAKSTSAPAAVEPKESSRPSPSARKRARDAAAPPPPPPTFDAEAPAGAASTRRSARNAATTAATTTTTAATTSAAAHAAAAPVASTPAPARAGRPRRGAHQDVPSTPAGPVGTALGRAGGMLVAATPGTVRGPRRGETLYSKNGSPLGACETDSDDECRAAAPPRSAAKLTMTAAKRRRVGGGGGGVSGGGAGGRGGGGGGGGGGGEEVGLVLTTDDGKEIDVAAVDADDGAEEVEATMGMLAKMQAQVAAHMARLRGATKW